MDEGVQQYMNGVIRMDKKAEAVARMKLMGIFPETIRQFEEDGKVSISEPPLGAFFWAEEGDLERIQAFEMENNALVYLIIRSYTDIGKMDSYLFVCDDESEWEIDREDIAENQALAYVYNFDVPYFSEFGSIGFKKTIAAGLVRTW